MAEQQRRRRERFKVGVYALLGMTLLFVSGMLIQGCKQQQAQEFAASTNVDPNTAPAPVSSPGAEPQAAPNPVESPFPADPAAQPAPSPASQAAASAQALAPEAPAPAPKPAVAAAAPKLYTVKRGDTLTGIAAKHHVTLKALKAANGLTSDRILAGSKLKIPQLRTVAAASAAAQS